MRHAFLYISLPSLQDYDVKLPKLTFYGGRELTTIFVLFFFLNLDTAFRIQLLKNREHLTN